MPARTRATSLQMCEMVREATTPERELIHALHNRAFLGSGTLAPQNWREVKAELE